MSAKCSKCGTRIFAEGQRYGTQLPNGDWICDDDCKLGLSLKPELFENPLNVRPAATADGTVVRQQFEAGEMFWFAPVEEGENGTIFALLAQTGQWWRGEDTWDGESEPPDPPPQDLKLSVPGGGFGKVWREQGFDSLALLGYAITGEETVNGWYSAYGDGWELHVAGQPIILEGGKQWVKPEPIPEPVPEPIPVPVPIPIPESKPGGWWVWLSELEMCLNLAHVVWVGTDRLRIGPHDIVLSLPLTTATGLRAYIRAQGIETI